jgi:hypothetical protein
VAQLDLGGGVATLGGGGQRVGPPLEFCDKSMD